MRLLNESHYPSTTGRFRPPTAFPQTSCRMFIPVRFLLLLAITLIIISTLSPFESSFSQSELIARFQDGATTSFGDLLKLLAHLAAFYALGCMVSFVYEESRHAWGLSRFVVFAILFCAALELAQFFQLSRHARVLDFLCNTAGLVLGTRTALRWGPLRRIQRTLKHAGRFPHRLSACIFLTAASVWCFVGLRPLMGALSLDWSTTYHLVVANETDGSRPWLGEIHYIGIYGRALDSQEVSSSYLSGLQSSNSGLLAGYDFTKAGSTEVLPEGSLRSSDLAISIPPGSVIWKEGGGMVPGEATILKTRGPAAALASAISSSGAFSVEAWVRPTRLTQTGPARIVGVSEGIWRRNFTFGQEDATGIFRVRNATSGPNGTEPELRVRDAIQSSLQHLVSVYDHGVSMLFRNGSLLGPVLDLREPNLILGLGPGPTARAAAGVLLTVLIALPAYSMLAFIGARRLRHLAGLLVAAATGTLPYTVSCLAGAGPWRHEFSLWMGAGLLVAYPMSFSYVYRRPHS